MFVREEATISPAIFISLPGILSRPVAFLPSSFLRSFFTSSISIFWKGNLPVGTTVMWASGSAVELGISLAKLGPTEVKKVLRVSVILAAELTVFSPNFNSWILVRLHRRL